MTAEDINSVRESLANVEGRAELVALLFYKRLFELVPELQPRFGPDLEAQMEKFLQLLQTSVLLMDSPELLVPTLESLGRRHAVYGVRDEHYPAIGQAFIWALGEALGRELNKDAVLAWAAFYEFLSATKQNGTVLSHAWHELAAR
jgi:hemoglobin-like flavoprotein